MTDSTRYSTPEQINDFVNGITDNASRKSRPMLVLDADGNIVTGYNVAPGVTLPLQPGDDPKTQAIPFGSDIPQLLAEGKLEPAIFAAKTMDIRFPEKLVDIINRNTAEGAEPERKFDLVILTSRGADAVLKVLEESGVKYPKKMTLVADSGATMYVGGEARNVRPLSEEEQKFMGGIKDLQRDIETKIDTVLVDKGLNPANRPTLLLESKAIAVNLHYRAILEHYGQTDGSELDKAIGSAVKASLDQYVLENGTKENGKPVFKTLDGPATVEVKIASVDKGKGLAAVIHAAQEAGYTPSSVIFSGDDICKKGEDGKVSPGTDYPAFAAAPQLQNETGIPFYTMHTLHPENGKLRDSDHPEAAVPNGDRVASHMGITPDIVVPDPVENAALVARIIERARGRAEMPGRQGIVKDRNDEPQRTLG